MGSFAQTSKENKIKNAKQKLCSGILNASEGKIEHASKYLLSNFVNQNPTIEPSGLKKSLLDSKIIFLKAYYADCFSIAESFIQKIRNNGDEKKLKRAFQEQMNTAWLYRIDKMNPITLGIQMYRKSLVQVQNPILVKRVKILGSARSVSEPTEIRKHNLFENPDGQIMLGTNKDLPGLSDTLIKGDSAIVKKTEPLVLQNKLDNMKENVVSTQMDAVKNGKVTNGLMKINNAMIRVLKVFTRIEVICAIAFVAFFGTIIILFA